MSFIEQLRVLNGTNIEAELAQGIVSNIATNIPELTDHSPGSPHVVMAEAMAWGASLLAYYVAQQPQIFEEYIMENLFHAKPLASLPAQALLVMAFSLPAPEGGRTLRAGTTFSGGGATWSLLNEYTFPAGSIGNETLMSEQGEVPVYQVPVVCNQSGAKYNVVAGTITGVGSAVPELLTVTNPAPAFGGLDTEKYEDMKTRYFAQRSNSAALVLPLDYERAVGDFLGANSRVLVIVPPPTPGYCHLSILMPDGTPLVSHPGLEDYLNRRSPMAPIRFVPPVVTKVNITAEIRFDPSITVAAAVQETAESRLLGLINPQYWLGWGAANNTLYMSAIISAMQDISGVKGVKLIMPETNINIGVPYGIPRLGEVNLTLIAVGTT